MRTTLSDPAAARAPDLVRRQFKAAGPASCKSLTSRMCRWTAAGFGYTALVIDAFAALIPGWDCSHSKHTAFVERAIRRAAAYWAGQGRPFEGTAIHHSDAGSQYTSPKPSAAMTSTTNPAVSSTRWEHSGSARQYQRAQPGQVRG